ncbi:CBS domain-containing protein [Flavobacterium antarcticum]|uniref:CBS domain-containing protein n=1 Tax=Flavobacterium antarcticum TaxID=271155 RepID=UPI0003B682E3|nr:CBS domain-containing protein [Flavobacterium antarcticum]
MTEINDYINNDYKPLAIEDTIASVQDFFADANFTHFPVVDERIYLGSIQAEDVEAYEVEKKISDYRFNLEGFFVRTDMVWLDVLEVFAQNQTNILPVLNPENIYVGYYEIQDIISFFNDTPFLKEHGDIIVVEKGVLDYSMSEVVQIVEGNGAKLLGSFISTSTSQDVQITLKITSGSVNEINQTFRRYGYSIISESQEDSYLSNLKERSDYLDKYLNI